MDDLERLTRAYGQDLFARLESPGAVLLTPAWFDERLMEWTMGDPAIKLQLFRFIDVLPLLDDPETTVRHLREYFEEAGPHLPGYARFGLKLLPRQGFLAGFVSWLARKNAQRLARRFIVGSNLEEALKTVGQLRRRKLAFTVDLLGEATITQGEAQQSQDAYLHLIEGLSQAVNGWRDVPLIDRDPQGPLPRVNVSLKLSAVCSQFDPIAPSQVYAMVAEKVRPIFRSAQRHGAFVNLDMEQRSVKDMTIGIFERILDEPEFRDWPDVGIAIQVYLKDCRADLVRLRDWARRRGTPVWIRLIKGAYWDYETVVAAQEGWPVPVFERKHETDANYEALSQFLLENRQVLRPAFGSHNIRSLARVFALGDAMNLDPTSYEVQMLYGMADPVQDALVKMGRRVRVYTPYGQLLPGMAYLVRRLLENTANESFLRASFTEHVSQERLLMNPATIATNGHASTLDKGPMTSDTFQNEPLTDFSMESSQKKMTDALADLRRKLGKAIPLVINGKRVVTAETIDSVNPSHKREIVGKVCKANPSHARAAIDAARDAFPAWRDVDPVERAAYLDKIAEVMARRRFEMAGWQVLECAKPWREADADVAEAIDFCRYYAREMRRLAKPTHNNVPGEDNAFFYEPRGVAVVLAPWNFPLAIPTGMAVAALVTGNTVILKPAEQSSVVASLLMDAAEEAGLPPGVLQFLPGVGEEIGPTLVEHPDVALVAFTGSRGVGLLLNRQTAEQSSSQTHIKKLIAELGGKNAIIVDDDADLDEAVLGVVHSAFGYQGQKCSACSRVIVLDKLHDVFVNRLVEATKSLRIAPAEDPGCKVGPVIDGEAQSRILAAIEKGKQDAKLVYAGDPGFLVSEGSYVGPHIFDDVPPRSSLAQEEIFGPVLAVLRAKDLDEALEIANGTSYALTGGVFSRSPEHIREVKKRFRVGNLYINRKITGALVSRQPFGGFKMSGIGSKAGGADYLLQFLLPRTITENTMRRGFVPQGEGE